MQRISYFIVVFFGFFLAEVYAEVEYDLSGHLKLRSSYYDFSENSISDLSGAEKGSLQDYNLRLRSFILYEDSSFLAEADINGIGGSSKSALESVLIGRPLLENDDRRLLNLSTTEGDQSFSRTSRFDRLFYRYQKENLDFKLGRQAFSFGNGLAFSVLDVFNPFSPVAFDREYKIGEDIASISYQITSNLNLLLLGVGRRNDQNSITADASSYGAFLNFEGEGIGFSGVISKHIGQTFLGAGFSKEISGAVARLDFSHFGVEEAESTQDFLINIDKGFVIFDTNTYFFIEYYRSGLGRSKNSYSSISGTLAERLSRGEIYTLGKNYAAFGGKIEFSDRVNFINALIFNLDDYSSLIRPYVEIEPNDDSRLRFGVILPTGSQGSEYGGFNVNDPTTQRAVEFSQGAQLFGQYALYF
jgi:hypothetical protein